MRMAIITEYLAKEGAPLYGGVDALVINLGRELAKRNEVHLFASLQNGEEGIERYGDMIVHRVGKSRPFARGGQFLSRLEFNRRCAEEVLKLGPDIIEASGFVSYSAGSLCRKMTSRPTMVTVHEVWQGEWSQNMGLINGAIGSVLERKNLQGRFDRFIAVSDFTKERIIERIGIEPESVSVIRNGVNRELYDSVEIDGKFDSPTIVTICRLVPYKHVDVLIQAVDRLRSRHPDIKLLIVGRGPEEENLRQLVRRLGLGRNVEFLGKFPDQRDMIRTLKRSHVFSLPSTVEGFGMVVVEAMAAGVPYVASDIPPIREVTKGGLGGKLIRPLDPEDLAEGLGETLQGADHIDSPRVSSVLEEYDWKNLSFNYESEARELVEARLTAKA